MLVGLWQMDREDLLGRHAAVPGALLYCAFRHICNLADASGGYRRRPIKRLRQLAPAAEAEPHAPSRDTRPFMCASAEIPAPDDRSARDEARMRPVELSGRNRRDGDRRFSLSPPSLPRGRTGCGIRPSSCLPRASRFSVLVALGELSLVRAVAVFVCIAAAALVPWRLHDAVTSREDVRGVNPVETAAVSAVVAGMPDPAVLLDRAGRVLHLNAAAAQLAPALRKNELAQFALRSPEIITALREGDRHLGTAPRPPISTRCRSIAGWN